MILFDEKSRVQWKNATIWLSFNLFCFAISKFQLKTQKTINQFHYYRLLCVFDVLQSTQQRFSSRPRLFCILLFSRFVRIWELQTAFGDFICKRKHTKSFIVNWFGYFFPCFSFHQDANTYLIVLRPME